MAHRRPYARNGYSSPQVGGGSRHQTSSVRDFRLPKANSNHRIVEPKPLQVSSRQLTRSNSREAMDDVHLVSVFKSDLFLLHSWVGKLNRMFRTRSRLPSKPTVADDSGVRRVISQCSSVESVIQRYKYVDAGEAVTKLATKVQLLGLLDDEMMAVERVALVCTQAWAGDCSIPTKSTSAVSASGHRSLSRLTSFLALIERMSQIYQQLLLERKQRGSVGNAQGLPSPSANMLPVGAATPTNRQRISASASSPALPRLAPSSSKGAIAQRPPFTDELRTFMADDQRVAELARAYSAQLQPVLSRQLRGAASDSYRPDSNGGQGSGRSSSHSARKSSMGAQERVELVAQTREAVERELRSQLQQEVRQQLLQPLREEVKKEVTAQVTERVTKKVAETAAAAARQQMAKETKAATRKAVQAGAAAAVEKARVVWEAEAEARRAQHAEAARLAAEGAVGDRIAKGIVAGVEAALPEAVEEGVRRSLRQRASSAAKIEKWAKEAEAEARAEVREQARARVEGDKEFVARTVAEAKKAVRQREERNAAAVVVGSGNLGTQRAGVADSTAKQDSTVAASAELPSSKASPKAAVAAGSREGQTHSAESKAQLQSGEVSAGGESKAQGGSLSVAEKAKIKAWNLSREQQWARVKQKEFDMEQRTTQQKLQQEERARMRTAQQALALQQQLAAWEVERQQSHAELHQWQQRCQVFEAGVLRLRDRERQLGGELHAAESKCASLLSMATTCAQLLHGGLPSAGDLSQLKTLTKKMVKLSDLPATSIAGGVAKAATAAVISKDSAPSANSHTANDPSMTSSGTGTDAAEVARLKQSLAAALKDGAQVRTRSAEEQKQRRQRETALLTEATALRTRIANLESKVKTAERAPGLLAEGLKKQTLRAENAALKSRSRTREVEQELRRRRADLEAARAEVKRLADELHQLRLSRTKPAAADADDGGDSSEDLSYAEVMKEEFRIMRDAYEAKLRDARAQLEQARRVRPAQLQELQQELVDEKLALTIKVRQLEATTRALEQQLSAAAASASDLSAQPGAARSLAVTVM